MSGRKTIGGAAATGGLLIAACAACCAPLIATPVIALFAAGGAGLALAGQVGVALLFALGGGAYLWWRHRSRVQKPAAKSCSCSSDTDGAPGQNANPLYIEGTKS